METKSVQIAIRIPAKVKKALDKAAQDDDRTTADYARLAVTKKLRDGGYLK